MRARGHMRVEIGWSNGWLIRSSRGAVLVDAGFDRFAPRVAWALRRMGLAPRDLSLVVITHAHFDHVGALADIVRGTGARVAVHEREAEYLRTGRTLVPRGLTPRGRFAIGFVNRRPRLARVPPVEPDVLVRGGLDLGAWGLAGRAIETPGHSPGSLTVVLGDGRAFVGDLVASSFRPICGTRASCFGDEPEELARSWRKVLDAGARVICPGHGREFPAALLGDLLARTTLPAPRA